MQTNLRLYIYIRLVSNRNAGKEGANRQQGARNQEWNRWVVGGGGQIRTKPTYKSLSVGILDEHSNRNSSFNSKGVDGRIRWLPNWINKRIHTQYHIWNRIWTTTNVEYMHIHSTVLFNQIESQKITMPVYSSNHIYMYSNNDMLGPWVLEINKNTHIWQTKFNQSQIYILMHESHSNHMHRWGRMAHIQ